MSNQDILIVIVLTTVSFLYGYHVRYLEERKRNRDFSRYWREYNKRILKSITEMDNERKLY